MKVSEFKLRILSSANKLVDQYFCKDTMGERFINATLKIMIKNNIGNLDSFLGLFADANGDIDAKQVVNEYAEQMGEDRVSINLRNYVNNPTIKSMIPDKTLTLTKEDLFEIINNTVNN